MDRFAILGAVLLVFLACACSQREPEAADAAGLPTGAPDLHGHNPDGIDMILPQDEIPALQRRALADDDEAANMLGNHYFQA
jgi:hypothetical protein